ncbi:MAG: TIGR04219 family outer membrane beta-barrel protein [Gammaproteobacteria bacterium]|nr:TIGR04219 family outer membrane beta-barrel protein [Gammaproteobacteria bacterium]
MALLYSIPVQADFVGLRIGADYWSPSLSGGFNSTGQASIDLSGDLGLDDPSMSSLVLSLEHPIPVIPNIRYQGIDLGSNGLNTLTGSITFEGQTYGAGETVRSTFDLSHDDIVLYYEILDNWVNLDVGLDLKRFDGEVSIVGTTNTTVSRNQVDETVPLLYLSARFDLPFSGFYLGANISSFSIDDSSADDVTIMLGYESGTGFGIEGGVRTFSLELDDVDGLNSDLEYDGAFVNGYFHF